MLPPDQGLRTHYPTRQVWKPAPQRKTAGSGAPPAADVPNSSYFGVGTSGLSPGDVDVIIDVEPMLYCSIDWNSAE